MRCPNHRYTSLTVVEEDVRALFGETTDHFGHDILALELADDHGHLFVQTDPKYRPTDIARQCKSHSDWSLLICQNAQPRRFPKMGFAR